jgi:hypothetical protein
MQVERTLVKSPPELWAEVSDVEALTRHLAAEFGEITITRVEPETKVAWEGEHASGTVELTASGWGTKVTLTAERREAAVVEPAVVEPAVVEPEPEPVAIPEPAPVAGVDEPEPELEPVAEARPRRWWRFWERRTAEVPTPPGPPTPGGPEPPAPPPAPPAPKPQPGPPVPPDPNPPQIKAVLTQVLDDLGQAHHRPFSRS